MLVRTSSGIIKLDFYLKHFSSIHHIYQHRGLQLLPKRLSRIAANGTGEVTSNHAAGRIVRSTARGSDVTLRRARIFGAYVCSEQNSAGQVNKLIVFAGYVRSSVCGWLSKQHVQSIYAVMGSHTDLGAFFLTWKRASFGHMLGCAETLMYRESMR